MLKGTAPRRRAGWSASSAGAARAASRSCSARSTPIEPGPAGLRVHVSSRHGEDPGWLDVTGVVCGTGFNKSALTLPLFRRLVEHYGLPVEDGAHPAQTNCGVPGLDRPDSRLA